MSPLRTTRVHLVLAASLGCLGAAPGPAAAGTTCELHSKYDLTVGTSLLFERVASAGERIEMRGGGLTVNGVGLALAAADRGRVASYEATVRALVPRVKTLGQRAVDLAAAALREEAASLAPRAAAHPQLNARVEARARELKTRIGASTTTREWRGTALNRYWAQVAADVLPLIAADLAQQALDAALRSDLARAAALQKRAAGLPAALEDRIRERLRVLEPEFARLCPSVRELDALEAALTARLPDGARLDLVEIRG